MWFVAPDPAMVSGGNVYNRRLADGLRGLGIQVRETVLPGDWPVPAPQDRDRLDRALAALPDGATVLVDGLVGCGVPEVLVPHGKRVRLAVLVHLPLADETGLDQDRAAELDDRERAVLHAATLVVTTSEWAADRIRARHDLPAERVHAVPPGVEAASLARGRDGRSRLLCVASVTPRKGHDLLVTALAEVADLPWTCVCAGPLPPTEHVALVRRLIADHGLGDRITLAGPLSGAPLDAVYDQADLLVLASRAETYGMVLTEALARGVPVLATEVDAVPSTVGTDHDGVIPGLLVPANRLAEALRNWLTNPGTRADLQAAARSVRGILEPWEQTARLMAGALGRSLL